MAQSSFIFEEKTLLKKADLSEGSLIPESSNCICAKLVASGMWLFLARMYSQLWPATSGSLLPFSSFASAQLHVASFIYYFFCWLRFAHDLVAAAR